MKEKECKYCGTKENLWTNKNGVIYNCCKVCYDTTEEKLCRYCGTKENMRTNKNGVIYNCCKHCYETIEVPNQIKKAGESFRKKYGVADLGELRQKRLKEHPPKPKEKKKVVCKYCGTSDNLIELSGAKRTNCYPACKDHWDRYQEDKHEARKKSNMARYGHEHPMDVPEFREKQVQAIHARSSEDKERIREKRKETNIEKFGVAFPIQLSEMKEKREETCIERFGVTNPTKLERVKDKQKETMLKKYGVTNPMQSEEIKNKSIQTNLERRGTRYPSQSIEVQQKVRDSKRMSYWDKFVKLLSLKKIEPLFSKEKYISSKENLQYKCLICNKDFYSFGTEPQRISCGCYAIKSSYEYEIKDWLQLAGFENIEENVHKINNEKLKYEMDIYLSEFRVGIEFHGLFWHSDIMKKYSYHFDKYNYFKEKGIRLIQVFENEWLSKNEMVKSIILNKLGKSEKIYARKCKLGEVAYKDYKNFLENNHIQGFTPASVVIGLYFEEDLVCLGSFGKNRFDKKDMSTELIRFSNKRGFTVVGGFQRILKHCIEKYNPEKIISFVDLRYFSGDSLLNNGFVLEKITQPNYFYFFHNKPDKLYSRRDFQKHKLRSKLEIFDPLLSEYENMINNGYLRIYDAGNLKMVKTY